MDVLYRRLILRAIRLLLFFWILGLMQSLQEGQTDLSIWPGWVYLGQYVIRSTAGWDNAGPEAIQIAGAVLSNGPEG